MSFHCASESVDQKVFQMKRHAKTESFKQDNVDVTVMSFD